MPDWKKKLAFVISRVLGPLPLLCLLWLATAVKSGIGFWKALWVYPLIFIVGIAIPTAISLVVMQRRKINFEWSNLKDRRLLVPIYIPFWLVVILLTWLLTNSTIFHLALLTTLEVTFALIFYLYLKVKISAHMMIASGVFWGVNFMTHNKYWWLFFFLIPLIWARLELKQHTWAELIIGLLLVNAIDTVAIIIFGWPGVP